jgi:Prokaryotic E2 family E
MSFLPERDRAYLVNRDLTYREVTDSSYKGVVLIGYSLPIGLYNQPEADILILLPPGYPDVPTDM